MVEQPSSQSVLAILGIARAASERGAGLSIRDALAQSNYIANRGCLNQAQLLEVLADKPEFMDDWIRFSEDKRTSGGWYIKRETREVGRLSPEVESMIFGSLAEAVAAYVVLELDFWANAA